MDIVEASLEGYDKLFSTGECLLDCSVLLGQNELSSTGTITVADPKGLIANALINHSLLNGGINKLEAPKAVPVASPPIPVTTGSNGVPIPGGSGEGGVAVGNDPEFTPEVKAFMDCIAYKEVHAGQHLTRKGYFCNNGVGGSKGYFSEAEAAAGFPASAGTDYNVGRYQFNRGDYLEFKGKDSRIKAYMPIDQDYLCLGKMKYRGVMAPLKAGDLRDAILRAGKEWASMPGSPYGQVQRGYNMEQAIAYYNQRLAYYKGGAQPPAKVDPTPTAPVPNATATAPTAPVPVTPALTAAPEAPVKGNKLTITIGEDVFTYYHQSTEYDAAEGRTTIGGQSIRYALDRRKRNRVVHNTSLKEFAQTVAANHKVPLSFSGQDIKFDVIDQRGITDYAALVQQAKQSGLFVSEDKSGAITIKPLSAVEDSGLVFKWRVNILSAKFKDEALDATKEDKSSALLQNESKATLDPSSGQIAATKPDVDKVPDTSVTGDKAPIQTAKPAPGQELAQAQARSRVKRVQGLPTVLVVPMSEQTRKLKPLDTIKTEGFQDTLNRIWVIDSVKHEPFKGTTTLNIYSPIEVLDLTPAAPPPVAGSPAETVSTAPIGNNVGGYIYPCSNTYPFTDFGRWHKVRGAGRVHAGVDFAGGAGGGTIVAIADGIVIVKNSSAAGGHSSGGGYGIYVDIDHQNGVVSRYCHMRSISCSNGTLIKQGQEVGKVGNTGRSFGDHLHFEVFRKGHTFGSDTINPATLPGLSRCGKVGELVKAGAKD
jgi:murein DD-endopeptidase MepM/ murein hydrolase activator NlpD